MTEIGLLVSRSLGHHGAKRVGVCAEPEVKEVRLSTDDRFLIVATDGLWTFIEPQEAAEVVWREMRHVDTSSASFGGGDQGGATLAAERLIQLARERWYLEENDLRDDISCVVVGLPVSATEEQFQTASARAAGAAARKKMQQSSNAAADGPSS
mmetsp:Transcript_17931/g.41042  ORF Transcript_17931/g.41042 Transcript_17931/m.41042 type:complete len:154 (+) Transcript_17931:122-583(+)